MKRLLGSTSTSLCLFAAGLGLATEAARAELVLSQLIVELQPGKRLREDIEVWNNSPERAYVSVGPSEIIRPGQAGETRQSNPDPEKLGLLAAPARMILEPGQRKLVRVASVAPPTDRERVYRVTVKPVAGAITSEDSGLKLLVGYDILVLVRPGEPRPAVTGTRSANSLTLRNDGNVSVELVDGQQCDSSGRNCAKLPGKRLYAGAEWTQQVKSGLPVEYELISAGQRTRKRF